MAVKEVVQKTLEMGAPGALGKCWGSKKAESWTWKSQYHSRAELHLLKDYERAKDLDL
jgi:hypothetical protein